MSDIDALKSLHTTLIDAEEGYETAIKDAEDPRMKAVFERMSALHARAHADVHAILLSKGERPDESGSFLSLVHKTVISVRSAIKGLDAASLPSFVDGEERIVGAYDKAMEATDSSDSALETLSRDRQTLVAAIAQMKAQAA
jgi:uncharacterized protein (TIGR02284 family)